MRSIRWNPRPALLRRLTLAAALLGALMSHPALHAASAVSLTADTTSPGGVISPTFAGLSFETGAVRTGNAGVTGNLFDVGNNPTNSQVITLFQQIGIRHLRIGGGSVDTNITPTNADIDALFRFAPAANVKVTYSLRLLNGSASADATTAQYISSNYAASLDSFAIGNEPDWHSYHTSDPLIFETTPGVPGTAYASYLSDWKSFATTITGTGGAAGAAFSGPDTGSNYPVVNNPPLTALTNATDTTVSGVPWTTQFASDLNAWTFPNSGSFSFATLHNYPGQSCTGLTAQQMIDSMLNAHWVTADYPDLYNAAGAPALPAGKNYRLTESNPFTSFVSGGSNCFGTALWVLDYMHWWAAANTLTSHTTLTQKCVGVNFHNKQWGQNDVIYQVSATDYEANPIGYGIKAFDLGGHGYVQPCTITANVDGVNLTAYAVGSAHDLYVTIVNKEHGSGTPKDATVTITPTGFTAVCASWIDLAGGTGGAGSLTATLGGATISNASQQLGTWSQLTLDGSGHPVVTVPATHAAVVHLRNAAGFAGPAQINESGTLQIFGVGSNGDAYRRQQSSAGNSALANWGAWTDMGGGVTATGGVATVKGFDNNLAIFVSGATPNTNVQFKVQTTPGGGFTAWTDLGGAGLGSLQAALNPDGSLHVFGLDASGNLQHNSQTAPGSGWTGWSTISGHTLQPGFVVAANKDGRLIVFGLATGASPHVWNIWQQAPSGAWTGSWTDMGALVTNPRLQVARNLDGRLEVFGLGANGHVYHNWQPAAGGWNGFVDLGTKSIQAGFVVGQNKDGRLVLVGIDAASPFHAFNIWESAVNGDATWTGWTDMSLPTGVTLNGQLVAASTSDFRLQLFAIGSDGHVWSNWQPTAGGWNGWADFGNTGLVKFYAGQ